MLSRVSASFEVDALMLLTSLYDFLTSGLSLTFDDSESFPMSELKRKRQESRWQMAHP